MTTIKASVIEDSVSPDGVRLTTLALKYPRFIHSELMTHRVFSRNASSSRAKPVERMIAEILEDTAMPTVWTKNQPGMQGYEECDEHILLPTYEMTTMSGNSSVHLFLSEMIERMDTITEEVVRPFCDSEFEREVAWNEARNMAIYFARAYHKAGYHKQVVNRILEPYMHIDVLVTATEWTNFFALRDHEMAEPHIMLLAQEMKRVMADSTPINLGRDEWHLPYVTKSDRNQFNLEALIKMSVARCSRVSYSNHEGRTPTLDEDVAQYQRLVGGHPIHASPAEHQATPDFLKKVPGQPERWTEPWFHGNLVGWKQFRKTLPNENILNPEIDYV